MVHVTVGYYRVVVSTAAFHARVRGSVPSLGGLKETKLFHPHPRGKVSIVGSLRDREVACSASDRQGSNFESCVWRTVSSQSSHHPQEVLLAHFSLYVHKGGLKPDSFHFYILLELLRDHGWLTRTRISRHLQRDMVAQWWACICNVGPQLNQCRLNVTIKKSHLQREQTARPWGKTHIFWLVWGH